MRDDRLDPSRPVEAMAAAVRDVAEDQAARRVPHRPLDQPVTARQLLHASLLPAAPAPLAVAPLAVAGRGRSYRAGREPSTLRDGGWLHCGRQGVYGDCMARLISTTVRLEEQDVRALQRARAAGHSASALIRKGLRVVASRYYTGRRPPSTRLFESTDNKLGDESELFRDLEA